LAALYPDDELTYRNLANVLLMTGRLRESADLFEKASELRLRAAVEADPRSAKGFNDLGALMVQTGRAEEAAAQFEKAVELKPDFAEARANLGGALAKLGRLDEALVQLRQAIASDAAYAPAHFTLGLVLSQRGDKPGAIGEWRSALDLDPKYAEAHASLGDALYAQGRGAEALAEWRAAIELQPKDASTLRQAAWVLATSPDPAIRNGADALAFAVRAVELTGGKDARALDALAAAYAEKEQFADAALTARRAQLLAVQQNQSALAADISARVYLYEAARPFRDRDVSAPRP